MKVAQSQKRSIVISPTATATATVSAALDCLGADYATIEVAVGVRANSTVASTMTIAITEGDASTGAWSTFNADLSQTVNIGTAGQVAAFHINCDGTRKRFLRVVSTPGTVATRDAIGIAAIGVLDSEISPLGTVGQADIVVIA